jgi:DNA-binding MarR family transcriptional regulator
MMEQLAEEAARELLATLPLLNRLMINVLQRDQDDALTIPQMRVLEQLEGGALTSTELARRRRVTLAAMGEQIQTLVERGWVVRSPDPNDRRQQQLALTEAGLERHRRAYEGALTQLTTRLAGGLSGAELRAIAVALPALHRALADTGAGEESQ